MTAGDPKGDVGLGQLRWKPLPADRWASEPNFPRRRRSRLLWASLALMGAGIVTVGVAVHSIAGGASHLVSVESQIPGAMPPAQVSGEPGDPQEGVSVPDPAVDESGSSLVDQEWLVALAKKTGIPIRALQAYTQASTRMTQENPSCGLGWNTLAGIGYVESAHGTVGNSWIHRDGTAKPAIIGVALDGSSTARIPDTDGGRLEGDALWDRALGPLQFIPSTWEQWGASMWQKAAPDPQNIDDAAWSAARYLCAVGGDLTEPDGWIAAVAAYNDSIDYNNRVAEAADSYAQLAGQS